MNRITLLLELQHVDTAGDENATSRAALQAKLADTAALDSARAALDTNVSNTDALKHKLRALELETGGLTDKLKGVGDRLYSGRITNAKELADLNQDEKMLQRRKSELEDQELALMEQIEGADNALREKRAALDKIATETDKRHSQVVAALAGLDAADADLAARRAALRAQLLPDALRVYDDLRQTKKGRAVVLIKNSSCSACGTAVPSGLISRVKLGSELIFCTNCERILAP